MRQQQIAAPEEQIKHNWSISYQQIVNTEFATSIRIMETRPIRPTMRPHDKFSTPPPTIISTKIMIFLVFYESVTNQRTDGPTDRRTDGRTDPVIEIRERI